MRYLLDSNVFMMAARAYYSFDLAPGYWDWLEAQHNAGNVHSTQGVRDEIAAGTDALSAWTLHLPPTFWRQVQQATITSASALARWASDPARPYTRAARDEFLAVADSLLVAEAHASGMTVVTHEVPDPRSRKRVKIPDACSAMDVSCTNPYDMCRHLGLRLVSDEQ